MISENLNFKGWLNKSQPYNKQKTHKNQFDQTVQTTDQSKTKTKADVDAEIFRAAMDLEKARENILGIFQKIDKKNPFLDPSDKLAFDREIIKGCDSLGRAHIIIYPIARKFFEKT